MSIRIYGSPRSSAHRCYWTLEELGLKYTRVPLDMARKEHKDETYLSLNPNGKVPCLVDGDFVIWESMAINHYLAEKYGRHLLGTTPEDQGRILMWSFWSLAELQRPLIDMLIQLVFVPEDKRDMNLVERSRKAAEPLFKVLDEALTRGRNPYLIGALPTIADINAASVAWVAQQMEFNLHPFPAVSSWLAQLTSRPAFQKVRELV